MRLGILRHDLDRIRMVTTCGSYHDHGKVVATFMCYQIPFCFFELHYLIFIEISLQIPQSSLRVYVWQPDRFSQTATQMIIYEFTNPALHLDVKGNMSEVIYDFPELLNDERWPTCS